MSLIRGKNIGGVTVIDILGEGSYGIVYLVMIDGKKYALKRQRIFMKQLHRSFNQQIWREIDFNEEVSNFPKRSQKYFMKMYNYNIINGDDPSSKNKYLDMIVEYKGDVIYELIEKNKLKKYDKYRLILSILEAVKVMRKYGYLHNDINPNNITYKNGNYSLIDYGLVSHKKYHKDKKSICRFEYLFSINNDMINFLWQTILQSYMMFGLVVEKGLKLPYIERGKINKTLTLINSDENIWPKIRNILYDKYKDWFDKYEDDGTVVEKWNVIFEILILLSAYSRKKYLKYMDWKVNIPNLIPGPDIVYMVKNLSDINKMIRYFNEK